ncbi:hypothetical protein PsYK624_123920 [Phanerochaete sordida]|uniref:DUF6533 domain-containing protein n=1 Tax=Phanerochaete sordida TaxID=48140 RepID=A0A9P3GHS3_9APHY|nr:hypothetical protein PsYK624_123920 [Phanerochaete sordida]
MFQTSSRTVLRDSRTFADEAAVQNYVCVAMMALILWEHAITLREEVSCMWQRKLSVVTVLFTVNRYGVVLYGALAIAAGLVQSRDLHLCPTRHANDGLGADADLRHLLCVARICSLEQEYPALPGRPYPKSNTSRRKSLSLQLYDAHYDSHSNSRLHGIYASDHESADPVDCCSSSVDDRSRHDCPGRHADQDFPSAANGTEGEPESSSDDYSHPRWNSIFSNGPRNEHRAACCVSDHGTSLPHLFHLHPDCYPHIALLSGPSRRYFWRTAIRRPQL